MHAPSIRDFFAKTFHPPLHQAGHLSGPIAGVWVHVQGRVRVLFRPEAHLGWELIQFIDFGYIFAPDLSRWRAIVMAKSLFWLSDGAWRALSPHLPRGRPGKPRVDDRTVISGICMS